MQTCFMDDPDRVIERHGTLRIIANEFPISALHLLLAAPAHRGILHETDLDSAIGFARAFPDYWVFHNMRGAGASRPEHLHFQALLREQPVPIELAPRRPVFETDRATVARVEGYPAYALAVRGEGAASQAFEILHHIVPASFNLVITASEIVVVPRAKEHPSGLRSTFGAPEMAGWIVVVEEELYRALTYHEVWEALAECGWSAERGAELEATLLAACPPCAKRNGLAGGSMESGLLVVSALDASGSGP